MALSGSVSTNSWLTDAGLSRYYTLSWTAVQSVTGNYSTISWVLKAEGTYTSWIAERALNVAIAGETVYSKEDRVERYAGTVASGTKVITHDSNGNASFAVAVNAMVYVSTVNCTASTTFTLTQIPRKSELTVSNGTLGTAQTITVTRKLTSYTHTITYKCGSTSGTLCTKSAATGFSWTPPIDFASQAPSANAVSVVFTIETFSGNTSIGTNTYTRSYAVPDTIVPFLAFTVEDENNYLDTYGGYVQGKSKFAINITAGGNYGSSIKSYKTTVDGKTYTTASIVTSAISGSGALTISVIVTDSRGRTATAAKNVTVLPYSAPAIASARVFRSNASGEEASSGAYLAVSFEAAVSAVNNLNTSKYEVMYKKSSESSYQTKTLSDYTGEYSVEDGVFVFAADTTAYDVILKVSDSFGSTNKSMIGPTASKLFSILARGMGIALGKVAEWTGFEVNMPTRFLQEVYIKSGDTFINVLEQLNSLAGSVTSLNTTVSGHTSSISSLSTRISNIFVTYGTNANGAYFKFWDGTLICVKTVTITTNVATAWGSMYESAARVSFGNWAYAFSEVPYVSITNIYATAAFIEDLSGLSAAAVGSAYLCRASTVTNGTFKFSVIGIGRWK